MKNVHSSVREVAVLQEATEMILSSMDADTVLHQILLIVRNYFGITNCAVYLVDPETNELYCRAQNGYDSSITSKRRLQIAEVGRTGVTGYVAYARVPVYVPDVSRDPRYLSANANIRSELALPLLVRDEVIGVLDVESDKIDYFSDEMIGLLALFAQQAAVALENARLYSTERRRMRQIEFINLIARSATFANSIDQLLHTFADLISDTFDSVDVSMLLRERDGGLALRSHAGGEVPPLEGFLASERGGIIAEAITARSHVAVNDTALRNDWKPCVGGSASELCLPMLSLGETLGFIIISHAKPNAFGAEERSIAQAASDMCATAIRNVQLGDELHRVVNADSLTGLFNQRFLLETVGQEVSRSRRFGKEFSILMFDLCSFRDINRQLTFDGGDAVLKRVAELLKGSLRSIDTACRYAGDRFALVLPETDNKQLQTIQEKLASSFAELRVPGIDRAVALKATFAWVHHPQDGATDMELVRELLSRIEQGKQMGAAAGV